MSKQSVSRSFDAEYRHFLKEIKAQVHQARVQAAHSISRQIIALYLQIGEGIAERQARLGWGKSVVEGFSAQNLWRMRQLYLEYKDFPILLQRVTEIPWGQNITIMSKIKDPEERAFYLQATADYGWTRKELPPEFRGKLPRPEELESELKRELAEDSE